MSLPAPPELPALLHLGDAGHGVDRYARTIARAVGGTPQRLADDAPPPRAHAHFTDRLWGADAATAAARFEALAEGREITVTLHDVPQASDGPTRRPRRVDAYRRVVEASSGVVCNSEHERRLLGEALGRDVAARVIPLQVTPTAAPSPRPSPDGSVAVLGFFYPGKGHREVVAAAAALSARPRVVALGRASAGHEGELAELVDEAGRLGVDFGATGFLPDAELLERSRAAAVPVIAHRHVSASGSLTDWIAAGRRPIVVDSAYFREMAQLRPGTTTPVPLDGLAAAIEQALRHPESTWQDASAVTRPHLDDTARAYLDFWAAR